MGNRRLLLFLGALAVNYLLFQSFLVPYGNGNSPWSSQKHFPNWNHIKGNASEFSESSGFNAMVIKKVHTPIIGDGTENGNWKNGMHINEKRGLVSVRNRANYVSELEANRNGVHSLPEKKSVGKSFDSKKSFIEEVGKVDFSVKQNVEKKGGISTISQMVKNQNMDSREQHDRAGVGTPDRVTPSTNLSHPENSPQKNGHFASNISNAVSVTRRKMRCLMPPKSRTLIDEMNRILVRRRASSRAMVIISLSIMNLLPGQVIVVVSISISTL